MNSSVRKNIRRLLLGALLCLLFAAPVTASVSPVINQTISAKKVYKRTVTYKKGQKLKLVVTRKKTAKSGKLTYSSSNPKVATVSKRGVITLKKAGKSTITITNGKAIAKVVVKSQKTNSIYDLANLYGGERQYFIHVSKGAHRVYVLTRSEGEWTLLRNMPCCVGKPSTPTPSGLFSVQSDRGSYFVTDGGLKCWYYTRIYAGYLFHSQLYSSASSPVQIVDGSMGVSCSHGCIRLYLNDARWIYSTIPAGTKVLIS